MEKTACIIDDDESMLRLLDLAIQRLGNVKVFTERTGSRAMEVIKSCNPDLVILDIEMPGMNGIEVCQQLRKDEGFLSIPIIAHSGLSRRKHENRILTAGFDEFLPKGHSMKKKMKLFKKYLHL